MSPHDAPPFSREAPPELTAPAWLLNTVTGTSRAEYISDHGFTEAQIGPTWWSQRGITLQLPPDAEGIAKLTRGDLFRMAKQVEGEESLLAFMWHVLAWGSGTSRRNNDLRITSCRDNATLLQLAFDAARGGDPRAAYSALIRRGGGVIPHLGPAFFSKFLYFASEGTNPRCLILDARVARSLWGLGWNIAPTYRGTRFSYNWYTDTYVSYCELLADWAAGIGGGASPDMFERALFAGPPSSALT